MDDLTPRQAKVLRQLSETATNELIAWAKREGILNRVTEEQFTDIAKAFMAGFGLGLEAARK
jgi:hypothetical protein